MSRDDGAAGRPKLTAEQRRVLAEIARMRPTAGNDDGWVHLAGRVPRPTVAALVGSGMIERFRSRHIGPTDQQAHRITSAGRLALTNPEQSPMSAGYRSDLVEVAVVLHHETAKAWLVSDTGDRDKAVWIPKSQAEIELAGKGVHTLTASSRLLTEKGLA